MAKLVRVRSVCLYMAYTREAFAGLAIMETLDEKKIPYLLLSYPEKSHQKAVLEALGTWYWGEDKEQRDFTRFPFVTWEELYDDHTMIVNCAVSLSELKNSVVMSGIPIEPPK